MINHHTAKLVSAFICLSTAGCGATEIVDNYEILGAVTSAVKGFDASVDELEDASAHDDRTADTGAAASPSERRSTAYIFAVLKLGTVYLDMTGEPRLIWPATRRIFPMAGGFLGLREHDMVHVMPDGHETIVSASVPYAVPGTNSRQFVGSYREGVYAISLDNLAQPITLSSKKYPASLAPAPGGVFASLDDGTYFLPIPTGSKKDKSKKKLAPSGTIVAAENGFIGVFSKGTYFVDEKGKMTRLDDAPTQILAAPGGFISRVGAQLFYFNLATQQRTSLQDRDISEIFPAPGGVIAQTKDKKIFCDTDGTTIELAGDPTAIVFVGDPSAGNAQNKRDSIDLIRKLNAAAPRMAELRIAQQEQLFRQEYAATRALKIGEKILAHVTELTPDIADVTNTCPICLDPIHRHFMAIPAGDLVRTACGHMFGEGCIKGVLKAHYTAAKTNPRCPVCRAELTNIKPNK